MSTFLQLNFSFLLICYSTKLTTQLNIYSKITFVVKQFGGQFVFDSSTDDYDVKTIYDVIKVYEDLENDVKSFVSFEENFLLVINSWISYQN